LRALLRLQPAVSYSPAEYRLAVQPAPATGQEFASDFEIYLQQAWIPSLITNARNAGEIVRNRLHMPLPEILLPQIEDRFSLADLRRSRADVVYGHSPTNVSHLPLICHTGPIYEEELRRRGATEEEIAREKTIKLRTVQRSELVTLNSEAGADTLRALDPASAKKIRSIPFFLPHLQAISLEMFQQKWHNMQKIHVLFVGREANRKGLPAALTAFQAANALYPHKLELCVVTNFADGPVPIPAMPNLRLVGQLGRDEVGDLMRQSHMLLMPSTFETYGWVYLEAMAAGAIAMACDAPAQQEIVDGGRAGILVQPTGSAVTEALLKLLAQPEDEMRNLAERGWQRIRDAYLPAIVAEGMKQLGVEAKERFEAKQG
jgi:glycosyltransferase involved in cell wall biosynthesis